MAGVYDMLPDRSQWEIEPRGNVWLLHNVPLSPAYTDTWKFPSAGAQFIHFVGQGFAVSEYVKKTYNLQSFTRVSENKYRCEGSINEMYDINYMVLDNYLYKEAGHTESKYFYCFVTNVEYVNNNCVEITFIVDILQTFMFDIKLNPCIIERRHSKTDNIGDNIVDEGIKIGDTDMVCAFARGINASGITNGLSGNTYENYKYKIMLGYATKDFVTSFLTSNVFILDNNALGIVPVVLPTDIIANDPQGYAGVIKDWGVYASDDKSSIYWVEIVPSEVGDHYRQFLTGGSTAVSTPYQKDFIINNLPVYLNKVGVIGVEGVAKENSYTPKNKKLFTYPFCYNEMSGGGDSVILRNEYFSDITDIQNMHVIYTATVYPNVECSLTPVGYCGNGIGSDGVRITRRGLPYTVTRTEQQSSAWWQSDVSQFMTQQGTNAAIEGIGTVISSAINAVATTAILGAINPAAGVAGGAAVAGAEGATGAAGGLLGSVGATSATTLGALTFAGSAGAGLINVASNYAQGLNTAATSRPNIQSSGKSGGYNHAIDPFTFSCFFYTLNATKAEQVDNYFTMFGYRENKIGNPEELYRPAYNYIQTTGLTVVGGAPASVLADIATIYNNGIRFWSPDVTLGDFSVDNSPTS